MPFMDDLINGYEMSTGSPSVSDPYGINAPFQMNYTPSAAMAPRPSDFSDRSPLAQFQSLASEAYHPGSYSGQSTSPASDNGIVWDAPPDPNEPAPAPYKIPQMSPLSSYASQQDQSVPFRDTGLGEVLGNTVIFGPVFEAQRGRALTEWARSQAANNPQMAPLVDMMAHDDPKNAQAYIPSLIAAQQGMPELQKRQQIQQYMQSLETGDKPQPQVGAAPQIPASGSPPVGVQNNNFTNIKDSPQNNWQGQTGANGGFAQFATPEDGFRAAAKTMDTYAARGIDNIDDLVKTWAPAADHNDPESYANQVSKLSGISRGQSINLADPRIQTKLLNAMQKVEVKPENAAPIDTVQRGVAMASGGSSASPIQAFHNEMTPEEKMAVHIASIDPTPQNIAAATQAFGKKGQLTPHTAAAEAQADLNNGLITQAQYDQMEKSGAFKANSKNLPSSIQEANAYEEAKGQHTKEGDQRAADIAMFAKTSGLSGMTANIDPKLSGKDFVNAMTNNGNGALAGVVQAIGDNDANAASLLSRGSLADKANLISAVKQYNPNWNQRQYEAIADFNNGTHGDQVKFTSNVTEHLELSRELFKALDNGDVPMFNSLAQKWAQATGSEVPTDFQSAVNIVGQEMVKSIVPSGGGVSDRDEAQKAFDLAKSKGQGTGAIDTIEKMMKTQIRGNERQFINSTGGTHKDFMKLISPQASSVLYPENESTAPKTVNWTIVNGKLVQQ